MPGERRSAFTQEVVQALVESKAIDFVAIGETLSKFGVRAALEGETLVHIVNRNVTWNCGWPFPEFDTLPIQTLGRPGG